MVHILGRPFRKSSQHGLSRTETLAFRTPRSSRNGLNAFFLYVTAPPSRRHAALCGSPRKSPGL